MKVLSRLSSPPPPLSHLFCRGAVRHQKGESFDSNGKSPHNMRRLRRNPTSSVILLKGNFAPPDRLVSCKEGMRGAQRSEVYRAIRSILLSFLTMTSIICFFVADRALNFRGDISLSSARVNTAVLPPLRSCLPSLLPLLLCVSYALLPLLRLRSSSIPISPCSPRASTLFIPPLSPLLYSFATAFTSVFTSSTLSCLVPFAAPCGTFPSSSAVHSPHLPPPSLPPSC